MSHLVFRGEKKRACPADTERSPKQPWRDYIMTIAEEQRAQNFVFLMNCMCDADYRGSNPIIETMANQMTAAEARESAMLIREW